jgi:aminoglycoside phosphotransferase (APT) family kinase protein
MTAHEGQSFALQLSRVLAHQDLGMLDTDSLVRLTGGASYETWSFDAEREGAIIPLILRRVPVDVPVASEQIGPETEAQLIRTAYAHGVPEPKIHHVLVSEDGIGRGFIAERVAGETLARRILRDRQYAEIRPRLAHLCGQALARIHAVKLAALPQLETNFALDRIAQLQDDYRALAVDRPVFELAFHWLRKHCPGAPIRPHLVHGDFRNGNLIVAEDGIRAVLDWELAHLGDPAEDLGWITVNSWRFGQRALPVGGFGTVDQLLEGYVAAGGASISREEIVYWRVMGSLSWGIKCHQMALPVSDGAPVSVERAMIGRRVSENELDLLDLLDGRDVA